MRAVTIRDFLSQEFQLLQADGASRDHEMSQQQAVSMRFVKVYELCNPKKHGLSTTFCRKGLCNSYLDVQLWHQGTCFSQEEQLEEH